MGKKINQLTPASDAEAANDNMLIAIADPTTGVAKSATLAQARASIGGTPLKYVATGAEGVTLTIGALAGKDIIQIAREGAIMYEVASSPDSVEFIWATPNITLGLATGPGERFNIIYR